MTKYNRSIKQMIEVIKEPILAILTALLISSFMISHTRVPTESMSTTINPGDHLIVNRLPYYYRNPKQGEIAVFKYKNDYLIKRVIGVPGDEIDIIDNQVYRNGILLDETGYLNSSTKTHIYTGSVITFPYVVPKDCYFMMGDNRSNSKDSRVFGPISRKDIVAKAGYRIFPFTDIGYIE